ncbi:TATA box binding protein associated factor (TAF), histone-like fold domain [Dillenia turbinata]|uniref:TATA box binding protein associated factor (TAF), histone-like fold domain n=1 Tax=Dillenia turbinata TaxID=194707 RepID=A0AAN8Z2Y8_9MAGN
MSILSKDSIEVIAQSIRINDLSSDAALELAPDVEYRMREIMQAILADFYLFILSKKDPLRFKKAIGHKDLYYIEDRDVDLKDIIEALLPKAPLDAAVMCHWLAIEALSTPETKAEQKEVGLPVDIRLPVKHVLSTELQVWSDSLLFKEGSVSLATDAGIHPLVLYFTCFIADEVSPVAPVDAISCHLPLRKGWEID